MKIWSTSVAGMLLKRLLVLTFNELRNTGYCRDTGLGVTVASGLKAEADKLAMSHERTEPVLLDVLERPDQLDSLIKSHSVLSQCLPVC